jgi:hypothetical protein
MKKKFICKKTSVLTIVMFIFNWAVIDLSAQQIVLGPINDANPQKMQRNIIPEVELIQYVENSSGKKGKITAVVYKLNNSRHKPTKIIKPHLYRASGKKIGEALLPTDISPVSVTHKGKEITLQVDISKYKIALPPEGVFVGLEYVGTNPADNKVAHPLTVWRNELNTSSQSYSKYKNVLDKDSISYSLGLCFGIQIETE